MSVRKVDIASALESLADYAKQVEDGDSAVIVTSGGRPVAAVIPLQDEDDLESILLSTNPKFMEIIQRSRARHAREGGISHEDFWQKRGL